MDIVALQEIRWSGSGECMINKYSILYSGTADEAHRHGVGIALSERARKALITVKTINERLIAARLNCKWFKLTFICSYAPTEESEDVEKDQFYDELQQVLEETPRHDIIIIAGDFNAKVGREVEAYAPSIGRESLHEQSNDNGSRLASFALSNDLVIGGTIFAHKNIHKQTWKSPDNRTFNQIDHILINKKHRGALQDVRSMRGAECGSDHYMVSAKVKAKLSTNKSSPAEKIERYGVEKLLMEEKKENYQLNLSNRFQILSLLDEDQEDEGDDAENGRNLTNTKWNDISVTVKAAAREELGYSRKNNNNNSWYDKECEDIVKERKRAKARTLQAPGNEEYQQYLEDLNRQVNRVTRSKKRRAINEELDQIDKDNSEGRSRDAFQGIKRIRRGYQARPTMIKNNQGDILTVESEVMNQWETYFQDLLNRPEPNNPIRHEAYQGPQPNIEEPTRTDLKRAIGKLKNNKSPGADNIPAELGKGGGEVLEVKLYDLLILIWRNEIMPDQWGEGVLLPIHKKGDKLVCSNYRGICLLGTAYKIFTMILYERLLPYAESCITDYQAGFRRGRSTVDQLFTIRQLIDRFWEYNKQQIHLFVDFKQAYDSVHRSSMWAVMEEMGIPAKLIRLTKTCYRNTKCSVRQGRKRTNTFEIVSGLKQGCILSPILFNIIMEKVARTILDRQEGAKFVDLIINCLGYADDIDIVSESERETEALLTPFKEEAERVGLQINQNKTKLMKFLESLHWEEKLN